MTLSTHIIIIFDYANTEHVLKRCTQADFQHYKDITQLMKIDAFDEAKIGAADII